MSAKIITTSVDVGETATKLFDKATNLNWRGAVVIRNVSDETIYIGGSDVSVEDGFPVYVGESFTLAQLAQDTSSPNLEWYAIHNGAGDKQVRILQV